MADDDCTCPEIDLLSEEVKADPYPTYAKLREQAPVCRISRFGAWAVTRYEDVKYVLDKPKIFSAAAANELYNSRSPDEESAPPRLIASQDPPEHDKYHALVNKAFLDSATAPLVPLMHEMVRSLLQNFEAERADFIKGFAYPYVGTIIGKIVGLEDAVQDTEELHAWLALEERISLPPVDEDYKLAFAAAVERQNRYFTEIMTERRKRPQKDLVTHLVNAEVDGRKLTDDEVCDLLRLIVSAGYVTTVPVLGNAVLLLSQRPDLIAALRESPQSIPAFGEELLRFSPSVLATVRGTTRAVEIAGIEIPANEIVMPILASANRDPRAFPDPDSFDFTRPRVGRHLAFGYGVHTCLGAALARLELRVVLEELLNAYTHIDCPSSEELTRLHTLFVRGISELPVRLS